MNLLARLFFKLIPPDTIRASLDRLDTDACNVQVSMDSSSRFYPMARVFNFQGEKGKIKIGENTHVRGELLVFAYGGQIEIGKECYIGEGTRIWSADHVRIGNHVLVSHNCNIIDTDSHELNPLERAEGYRNLIASGHSREKRNINARPVIIEDYAWLSYNVSILKGVTVGKGAIVAAGSVVTSDVEPFCVVAGNPARVIKKTEPLS